MAHTHSTHLKIASRPKVARIYLFFFLSVGEPSFQDAVKGEKGAHTRLPSTTTYRSTCTYHPSLSIVILFAELGTPSL